MTDTSVLSFRQPGEISDPLTEVLRQGARELLAQAVEAEVCAHLEAHTHLKTDKGLQADRTPWSWPQSDWLPRAGVRLLSAAPEPRLFILCIVQRPVSVRSFDLVVLSRFVKRCLSAVTL